MKILTPDEVRAAENRLIEAGTPADILMERAASGIVATLRREYPGAREALFLAGKGNNGGDGLAVARRLLVAGWRVSVGLAFDPAAGTATALCLAKLASLRAAVQAGEAGRLSLFPLTDPALAAIPWPDDKGIVVDALLGIGARGALSPAMEEIVALANRERNRRFFRVVALDGPTGAHQFREGEPTPALTADLTLTIGFGKEALFAEEASDAVGRIAGIPIFDKGQASDPAYAARPEALVPELLLPLVPRRHHRSHKGNHGRILIVGGSRGMAGAPLIAATGALKAGAGLLHIAPRNDAYPAVAARAPLEAMVLAAGDGADFTDLLQKVSVLAVGPGLGTDYDAAELLRRILAETEAPLVLDADGLNLAAADQTLLAACRGRAVLTPHPGEMKRLLGHAFAESEREAVAARFAEEHGVVLVLKGVRTIVAAPGCPPRINTTGNPGLAAGGSGDLLTGVIAAQIGRGGGMGLRDAASLGVWLHGRAADLAVRQRGVEEGLGAVEVAEWLAPALADLRGTAWTF